ncbi:MAG: DivIVA domain-containing protein [Streptosporangiaceae bacterium]|nr:DivIVA domain-containing protein [Streptosporangiaceae bacterium]
MTIAMHPDRLTPEYLQSIQFPTARLGKRGVDETHVRAFCEWVETELIRLLNEKTALEQEVWRLRERVREADVVQPEDGHVQAVYILSRAQQTADKYVANAQEYSRDIAEDARRRREEILTEAKTRAAAILDDAHASATRDAATMVSAPVAEEPMTAERRQDLETELTYLRTFTQVCRTHLRAYLESLTRSIDEWEHAEHDAARR